MPLQHNQIDRSPMNELTIDLEQAMRLRDKGALLVDARSPAEFAKATIPGAINVPILNDAERAEIGTLYKQQGKNKALKCGIDLVAPKIPQLLDLVLAAMPGRKVQVVVFCWRGGMRSKALTSFLDLAGIPAQQLLGGHKAFRRSVLDFFETANWGRMLVLHGLTGVGKTQVLRQLSEEGYPVIDLEGLANHRGSAFGNIGLVAQPSQQMFDALLWDHLRKVGPDDCLLVEGESRHIGRVALPKRLYQAMRMGTALWLTAPLERRVDIILNDYPDPERYHDDFTRKIEALRGNLGGETTNRLLRLLDQGSWRELVEELMVNYYDPLYRHTQPDDRVEIALDENEPSLGELKTVIDQLLQKLH